MPRLYGRAPAGERIVGSVPQNYGQHVTMLGTLGVQGLHAVMTVDGATDADVFRTYLKQVLGPTLSYAHPGRSGRDGPFGSAQSRWRPAGHRQTRSPFALFATVLARPVAHRILLVEGQNSPAQGSGAHARSARCGDCRSHDHCQPHGCPGLVQALRLSLTVMCKPLYGAERGITYY